MAHAHRHNASKCLQGCHISVLHILIQQDTHPVYLLPPCCVAGLNKKYVGHLVTVYSTASFWALTSRYRLPLSSYRYCIFPSVIMMGSLK